LAVPTFFPSDPIACMNKAMAFLSAVFTPRYPSTNNQLISFSNPRNQATVQDGRVTVQQVQGRQRQNVVGSGLQGNALGLRGNTLSHAKEKVLLVQTHTEGKELDEEQLSFLADSGVANGQVAQTITHNAAFQTDDLDAYDSDCDDISSAKAVLMANLSSCDSYVLSEANNESKIINESLTVELERYKERVKILKQRFNVDLSGREKFIDLQMDDMIRMKNTKFAAFETEIDTLKQTLSKHVKEKESLLTTLNGFKTEFKERESKSIDKEIVLENKNKELENIVCKLYQSTQAMHMLTKPQVFYDNTHKQALGYQNPFYLKRAQRIKPILYDGNVLSKTHDVLSVVDDEETLILAEESRLKMVEKQNDPIMKKEKINITPINYSELNNVAEDFGKQGLHKGYNRFQSLLSQLMVQVSPLKMPIRSSLDLYLLPGPKVFESDVKGSTGSSSSAQNVAFVSSESTSSTNDVSTAYGVSTSSGYNSQRENSSSYTDELIRDGLEMASSHDFNEIEEVLQETSRSRTGTLLESADQKEIKKVEEEMQGTLDIEQKTMGGDLENRRNLKLCNSGLDTEVKSCSKECVESYAKLKKLYDEQREQLGDASIEIQAYTQALKKVEAQLVAHQKNQLWYEEKIRFMKIDLDDKTDVLTYHKKLLAEAVKEKEELKTKLENFQSSSKGLSKLLNSQMSTRDKSGLGYGDQVHNGVLSYENEVFQSVLTGKGTGQGENRPMWNNVQRLNFQNKFVPKAVLTKTGIFPVNTARQNLSSQAATTSTARKVNTARPIVNVSEVKAVSAVGGKRETAVKPSTGCNWRPKRHYWNKVSKYNSRSSFSKNVNFKDHRQPKSANDLRTPQQNRVAERKNRTLIEAARTMLADSFLPNTFWAEAVSTACYVLNRVLVTKPQNKTPYELITGKGPNWLFDLDYLTDSMNYQPVTVENKANKTAGPKEANHSAGTQDNIDAGNSEMETEPAQEYFILPVWSSYTSTVKSSEAKNGDVKPNGDTGPKTNEEPKKYQEDQAFLRSLKA
ncbi:reverse transcriptase domain-containing protein, partial [Tanacetum coccineum]